MEEQIIIKSKKIQFMEIFKIFLIITAISFVVFTIMSWFIFCNKWVEEHNEEMMSGGCYQCDGKMSAFACALKTNAEVDAGAFWFVALCPPLGIMLVGVIVYLLLSRMEIVVTNKRVYGKTYFGKNVDLPLDSISSVGSRWFKGISVSTSSGLISFLLIKNAKEIHEEIRKLLIERQDQKLLTPIHNSKVSSNINNADELKKYKELLDDGIITQEEFAAKKKQLLGL